MKRNTQHLTQAASSAWQRVAFAMLFLLSIFAAINGNRAYAAPPPAGTSIGNQASATYADALGNAQTPVTSNTVVTTVSQVASFTLTAAQTKTGAPGTQVYFPHTLTNTGNGTDTFDLSVTNLGGGTFDFASVAIYADANGDGVPDNATPLTSTGALASAGVFKFVAVGVVPSGAVSGQVDTLQANAVGNGPAATAGGYTFAPAQSNVDTVNVTGNAVINVTKSMSGTSGADGSGPYTVTLTYTNGGNSPADTVDIGDVIPAGMTYVGGSARWSVTGALVLSDLDTLAQGTAPNTVIYDFGVSTPLKARARINKVAPGASGTITFQVNITAGTAPGNVNNTATYAYNDNNGTGANIGPVNTNTVAFNVLQRGAVVLDDVGSVANGVAGSLAADSNATADIVGVASAPQGATVQFDNVVHNNGNGADSFDMSLSLNFFPPGTSFQFYGPDGVTPMVDTNGNSTPDTGAVAAGGTYHVIVKAILPIGAFGNNSGAGWVVTKTATSKFDPTKLDTVTDKLDTISANTVDLTNTTWRTDVAPAGGIAAAGNAATTGFGPGTATAVTTNATNPGTTTTFKLYLNNTSVTADNYDLTITSALPAGWTMLFKNDGGAGNCSTTGATITNSGIINAANSKLVCALVSVPATGAGAVPGTTNLTFRALSAASGAVDTKVDAVTVNIIHNVVLTPNNAGQAFPGNFVVYTHTITNNGNTTETISFPAGPPSFLSDSTASWSSVLYRDNGTTPGALDAGDTSVSSATTFNLAAGASATLFVKVTAPLTAPAGQTDTTTIIAAYNGGASTTSATDITTVISGVLTLAKEQALDAACDGTPDTAYGNGTITARPGQCVRYRITATNVGTANVTSVVLSDSTPANTLYNTGGTCFPAGAPGSFGAATTVGTVATTPAGAAANCAASVSVSATVGTLTPAQNAELTFGVQVNQ